MGWHTVPGAADGVLSCGLSPCVDSRLFYRANHAAEVARAGVPTIKMVAQSLHGISHHKIEDTKEEHLEWP